MSNKSSKAADWMLVERDHDVLLVQHWTSGECALVSWDTARSAWQCSQCQEASGRGAPQRCAHVIAATRDLPLDLALRLSHSIGARRPPLPTSIGATAKSAAERQAEEANARVVRAGVEARAARVAVQDRLRGPVASDVVVRQQTPEDRARLAAARARRARSYETSTGFGAPR